jgi:hypothetical protein
MKVKSIRLDKDIFSIRNDEQIKLVRIEPHFQDGFKVITNVGESSLSNVYKYGDNLSIHENLERLKIHEKEFIESFKSFNNYCDHLRRLSVDVLYKSEFRTDFRIHYNNNLLQVITYDRTKSSYEQFKTELNSFLTGFKYGIMINGK